MMAVDPTEDYLNSYFLAILLTEVSEKTSE